MEKKEVIYPGRPDLPGVQWLLPKRLVLSGQRTVPEPGVRGHRSTILGEYHLDRNGKLVCENYYFTHWDPAMEKEEVYWNTVGVPDRARSKKLAMNPAQFQELQKKRKDKVEKLSWQSLARYGQGRVILSLSQSGEGGEPLLVVIPGEPLEAVHLLTLQAVDISDSGQVTWQVEKDEPLGKLEAGTRYHFSMALEGTARVTALSYYDRAGYHRKILRISGEDGSLFFN